MTNLKSVVRVSSAFVLMVGVVVACVVWNVAQERRTRPLPRKVVKVVGRVVDSPRDTERQLLFTMYVDEGQMKGKRLRCYVPKDNPLRPELGHRYAFWGKLLPFNDFETDGHFSYRRWAVSHSLAAQSFIRRGKLREAKDSVGLPLMVRLELKARQVQRSILSLFEEEGVKEKVVGLSGAKGEHFSLVAAMAFGDKSTLGQDTRNVFTRTGVAHLLALSGLHLGILYALLSLLFVRYRYRVVGSVVVVMTVWMYVFVVGMPASVVRAATMLTLYSLLSIDGACRSSSANPLYVAVGIILLVSPRMLWDVGFQMSVLAVWSVACVYTPVYRLLPHRWLSWHVVRALWAMVVVSVVAQLGVAPLVVYYFGNFSYVFLLTNLVAVPLVTILLYAVFLSLVLWWCPPLRHALLWLQALLTNWLESLLRAIDSMGGVSVSGLQVDEWGLVGMYVAVVGLMVGVRWLSRRLERKRENNLPV